MAMRAGRWWQLCAALCFAQLHAAIQQSTAQQHNNSVLHSQDTAQQHSNSVQRSIASLNTTREQVTFLLDSLLNDYDKTVRPGSRSQTATTITSYINIRSMGPISELDMDYSLNLYFRQLWQDPRLRYDSLNISDTMSQGLVLSLRMLDNIWKPDTYFINGKGSNLHKLTTPNKLIRLYPNGEILYSMRLTVKASCPMHLRYFPMDEQVCPLFFGSYGYPSGDIVYRWRSVSTGIERAPVVIANNVTLSQFNLSSKPEVGAHFALSRRGNFSVLSVYFHFARHTGFFIIQVYIPCSLLVVLSWVSFWINREATADRVALGVTAVLTLTTLCMDSRQNLPRVGYATALDYYIFTCYSFLIASIVEFACVHHFTKFGYSEYLSLGEDSDGEPGDTLRLASNCHVQPENKAVIRDNRRTENSKTSLMQCLQQLLKCMKGPGKKHKSQHHFGRINSVSKIDQFSKFCFPMAFFTINTMYWLAYLKVVRFRRLSPSSLHEALKL